MRKAQQSLSAIANAGPDAALKETDETLSRAFDATHPRATEELRGFISTVRKWLDARDANILALRKWVEEQVDPWLRRLGASTVTALVGTVPDLHDRLRLLREFFETDMRSLLGPALEATAASFAGASLQDMPPEEQDRRVSSALKLVEMAAVVSVPNEVEGLARVLSRLPEPLVERVFVQAGRLDFFDFYLEELARALPLAEPHVTDAFAAAFAGKESLRLRRLLEEVATHARQPADPVVTKPPSRDRVEKWFVDLRRALGRHSAELQRRVEAFSTALLHQDRELSTILSSYLNALPENHEDVFDLLSAHSQWRREGYPPPSPWGMPSVMSWISGSMRSGSITTGDLHRTPPDPPDFDWRPALRAVSEPVLRKFILAQTNPAFALDYLNRIYQADHPGFEMLCAKLTANSEFRSRLQVAPRAMSAVVLQMLDHLRLRAPALKELYRQLVPELIPVVPAEYLREVIYSVLRFEEGLVPSITRDLERRFPHIDSVPKLAHLLECALIVLQESEVRTRLLDKVSFHALVPGEEATDTQLEEWLYAVAGLPAALGGAPEQLLLSHLPRSLFGRMYALTPWGPGNSDTHHRVEQQQALKYLFIEEWARHTCVQVHEALHEHLRRDFDLWWMCRFPEAGSEEQLVVSAAFRWLQVVARHCPDVLPTYLYSLMHNAWTVRHSDRYGPYIESAARFVSAWLRFVSTTAGKGLWLVLLARLEALPEDDYESAAALAAVDLPANPGVLAAFRARAVPEVRKRVLAASTVNERGSLRRLRDRLSKESPELVAQLLDGRRLIPRSR